MEAIRFKWTVRREDEGRYFVDETIGDNSRPITSGPMSAEDAIRFVDDRESEARQRFDRLKSEMTGRAAAANVVRHDGHEGGEMRQSVDPVGLDRIEDAAGVHRGVPKKSFLMRSTPQWRKMS